MQKRNEVLDSATSYPCGPVAITAVVYQYDQQVLIFLSPPLKRSVGIMLSIEEVVRELHLEHNSVGEERTRQQDRSRMQQSLDRLDEKFFGRFISIP